MQESIKLARSKAKNPDQENIRQLKQDWNADTSEFVHSLIQFKKLMNGRESDFYKQKSKITDPIPVEPSIVIQSLAQKFKELAEQAYTIGNKQKEYSGNRLARRKEASNKITRLLSYIKGPHFGTSPEATLNRSRKSLLSLAADVSKDFKILNSKILGRNHGSLLEAGAVFKRLRETLSAFVTFLNNLENPTKELPEPKNDEKKSRKINYMHHYLDYFAGPGQALDKIKTELKTVLNAIKIDGKEHLLPLIFNNIEEIEKIGNNIEKSEDDETKAKLAEYLFEKIQALKEALKALFPENIIPPRKDNTIKAFVDAFKAKDFPKKDGHILGRPKKNPIAPKAPNASSAPSAPSAPNASIKDLNATPVDSLDDDEGKIVGTKPEDIISEEEQKKTKINELIEFRDSNRLLLNSFIYFCENKINSGIENKKQEYKTEVKKSLNEIKTDIASNALSRVVSAIYDILSLYIFNSSPPPPEDSPTKTLFNSFNNNYANILKNKDQLSNENLSDIEIDNIKSLFEKTKTELSNEKISNGLNNYEFSSPRVNYTYFETINNSLKDLENSQFKIKLNEVIKKINDNLTEEQITLTIRNSSDIKNALKAFSGYLESDKDRKKIVDANKNKITKIVKDNIKKNAKDLLEAAVQDFKTLNQIPEDANPKTASDLIATKINFITKASSNNNQLILTGQNKAFDWAKRKLHEISFWNKTSPLRLKISDFAVKAKKATDELMDDLEHRISFELLENYKTVIIDLFSRIEDLMTALLAGSEARSANIDDLLEARYLDGLEISPEEKTKLEKAFALQRQRRVRNSLMG